MKPDGAVHVVCASIGLRRAVASRLIMEGIDYVLVTGDSTDEEVKSALRNWSGKKAGCATVNNYTIVGVNNPSNHAVIGLENLYSTSQVLQLIGVLGRCVQNPLYN
jgi:hypothetical protein